MPLATCEDPLATEALREYFAELYFRTGPDAMDAGHLDGAVWPILPAIAERAGTWAFRFAAIAKTFRFIEEAIEPEIVPWRANEDDREAERLLERIAAMDRPFSADLRLLQAYTVPLAPRIRALWLAQNILRPVHQSLGDALLRLDDLDLYDTRTGLRPDGTPEWSSEANIIG